MKKFVLGILGFMGLGVGAIFAQSILPDNAEIGVKDTIIEGEATNLSVTMTKNGAKMTNYVGTIYFTIEQEDGSSLKSNEYTLPNGAIYTFLPTDLGSKEFQKGLEIKKEGTFYIQVEDLNDPDEKILGRVPITVIRNTAPASNYHIDVFSPMNDASITNEKLDILAGIPELPNSKALVYIDNNDAVTVDVDSAGIINYSIANLEIGRHTLKIEVPDIDGSIMGSSDIIPFTVIEGSSSGIRDVTAYPENGLMVGDKTKITVFTDEMVESVKMRVSDRPENDGLIMSKDGLGEFSYNLYLISTGDIQISLETATANNSIIQNFDNIKQITVINTPEIANATVITDDENQVATVSWEVLFGDPVSGYLVKYRGTDSDVSGEEETDNTSFRFNSVPFDTEFNVSITPIRKNALGLPTHGAASKTIQFIVRKPGSPETMTGDEISMEISHKCTVQNIATHTTKIGNNYYLIRDKVENVSKYIVYSSTSPDGSDKVKVYETSDNSYEYPFDYESNEDKFMYFWIVGICDDGEELELTGATKVQVGPAENFFLLLCLTFLIYFGIKLFRETE